MIKYLNLYSQPSIWPSMITRALSFLRKLHLSYRENPEHTMLHSKILLWSTTGDECRIILFEEPISNKVIRGHAIRSEEVPDEGSCRVMCYMEPNCVSINVRLAQGGKYKCELNNATVDESKLTFLQETDAYYLAIEVNASQ